MRNQPHVEHELELALVGKEPVAAGVVRLTLCRPDRRELPEWEPGAHIDLILPNDLVRQYSLCGDPSDRTTLQVSVLREEGGRGGSQYVHDKLAEGDLVQVRGPRNHFPLVNADRYLFIAGGIGITPIVPMVSRVAASGAEWRLIYGCRSRSSMAFRTEFEERYAGEVTLKPQDESGLLDLPALLADPGASATDLAVYCCGPEALITAVEDRCASWPEGALHVERFSPKGDVLDGPQQSFEVELAQTGMTLTVPSGRTILEVVEEAGLEVPHSCRDGICGTCETPVLSGTPDHRDSILTKEEQAACDTMMICCSRARSSRLVLDL